MEPSFHDPRCLFFLLPSRMHMFLFIQTSLSLFPGLASSLCIYSDTSPSFFFLLHLSPLSVPMCPAFVSSLVSITTATFRSVHNHFWSEVERDENEMRQRETVGRDWKGNVTQVVHQINEKKRKWSPKQHEKRKLSPFYFSLSFVII